jgi:hypothetical protein
MKVFTARAPELPQPDDFSFTLDGELVTMPIALCDCPECGCQRSMAGLATARATTTFTVSDLPMDFTEYVGALRDGLTRQGYWRSADDDRWLLPLARDHACGAQAFDVGALLCIDRERIRLRGAAA